MIRRPLNSRFRDAVLSGRKFCTMRDTPWPIGVPIMLYEWTGAPYRSKQAEVAVVVVEQVETITIRHTAEGMRYSISRVEGKWLWEAEGFDSGTDIDEWFSKTIQPGGSATKFLHRFKLIERGAA